MKFAYADPPYIGQAKRLYGHEETNHSELIKRLQEYDGWALSMSATMYSLKEIIAMAPNNSRLAAWVKPWCAFKPNNNPAYTWEPVLFKSACVPSKKQRTIKDHTICNIAMKKGLAGAKPQAFCFWIFDLLGMNPEDSLDDIFPGTGIVSKCWEYKRIEAERRQLKLF